MSEVVLDPDKIIEELGNKRFFELDDREHGLLIAAYILKDSERKEAITLRDYCYYSYYHDITPSIVLKWIRPYLSYLNKELAKRGFVRVSRYAWRKFLVDIEINEDELKKLPHLNENDIYVLTVAYELLKVTKFNARDWKGYNIVDAFKIYDLLYTSIKKMGKKEIGDICKRLLKYKEQIKGMGYDFERIEGYCKEVLA